MCANETWRVILESDLGDGAPGAGATQEGKAQKEASEEIKKAGPHWANVGKFAGGLLGVVGTLAFVIQMIRRSRIFTTFMDSFLLVFSAFIDIMMIPLIPIFSAALKLIVKLLPLGYEIQKKIADWLKDPWKGVKDLFDKIPSAIRWMGEKIGGFFSGLGATNLGELFKSIGEKFGKTFEQITPIFSNWIDKIRQIWSDDSTAFWDKIVSTAGTSWETIIETSKILWDTIQNIWNENIVPFFKLKWDEFYQNTLKPKWDLFMDIIMSKWTYFADIWLPDKFNWFISQKFPEILAGIPRAIIDAIKGLWSWGIQKGAAEAGAMQLGPRSYEVMSRGQFGGYIPQTGLYMLHRGEEVITSQARSVYNQNRAININNIYNISTASPFVARGISQNLDEEVRAAFLRI